MDMLNLIILALIGEAIWETLKLIWQEGKLNIDRLGAIAVGLLLTFGTGLDILQLLEIPMRIPLLGSVLTALLISRGANFMHDILASINNIQHTTRISLKGSETNPEGSTDGTSKH